MHRAPVREAAGEGLYGVSGEAQHPVPDAGGRGSLGAAYGEEGLGHGQGDFVRVKTHHGAIAADDLKPQHGLPTGLGKGLEGQAEGAGGVGLGLRGWAGGNAGRW